MISKKHQCPECGEKFSKIEEVMNHAEVHSSRAYDCRMCGESYPSMEAMRSHLQKMHSYGGSARESPGSRREKSESMV